MAEYPVLGRRGVVELVGYFAKHARRLDDCMMNQHSPERGRNSDSPRGTALLTLEPTSQTVKVEDVTTGQFLRRLIRPAFRRRRAWGCGVC
jgi:hypothetical protein